MNYKVLGLFVIVLIVAGAVYLYTNPPKEPPQPPSAPPIENQQENTDALEVHNVDSFLVGKTKKVRGIVIKENEGKGNLYFTLKDVKNDATIKGVLFAKTIGKNPDYKPMLLKSLNNKSVVYLEGEINNYEGELEIKTWQVFEK